MADTMSNVKLIIYKKIVDGDLRKFSATSNDQPSGGGARDLRFSPAGEFMAAFEKMFRFLYKGIIIKHNKTEPTYTKTSLFLCEKRRFFMARTEKGVVTTI